MIDTPMIGLAEAAALLKLPYQTAHRLLLTGLLRGEKRESRWWVTRESVERVRRAQTLNSRASPAS